ncbi:MAG: response regulator [bacterium]
MIKKIERVHAAPPPNVLIVDDVSANLELLAEILRARGLEPRPVLSGQQAIMAALADPPDLILLDINMPGMNGFEVHDRLKAESALKDIPVIFITASDETLDKVKAFSLGAVDYVTKPFRAEEVCARCETHLRLRNLQVELADTVSELKAANITLDQNMEQLRKLTAKLAQVDECERKRMALLLHDQLQQILVASIIKVGLVDRLAPKKDFALAIREVRKLLDAILVISRSVTTDLFPPIILDAGLVPSMRWLADWMCEKHGLLVVVSGDKAINVSESLRLLIFQTVRELLCNVVKHAKTTRAEVDLDLTEAALLRVVVTDHGVGFSPDILATLFSSEGLGLFFLRERLAYVGGTLEVATSSRQGAQVSITVPINRK